MNSALPLLPHRAARRPSGALPAVLLWVAGVSAVTGGASAWALAEPLVAPTTAAPTATVPAAAVSTVPLSAGAQALRLRSLAASCAQCHGTDGRAGAGTGLPALAGMPAPVLQAQMRAFKNGTRPASVMTQLARGFSDAQIDQLASFFASQTSDTSTKDPS